MHMPTSGFHRNILAILLGQFLSLLIAGTGLFAKFLQQRGFDFPTIQSTANYVLLCVVFMPILLFCHEDSKKKRTRQQRWKDLLRRSWKYMFIAIADVEGNFFLVKAYQFTSITSVTLLDCFTIPCVMILSFFILRARYNRLNILGVMIAVAGLALLVSTEDKQDEETGSNPLLGDALVICGTFMYAISNVGQEKLIKDQNATEWLAMIGFFGTIVSGVQALILEREFFLQNAEVIQFDAEMAGYLVGFVGCLFLLYSLVPRMLILSSATFYNISILTADSFSALFASFLLKQPPSHWFYVSFVIVSFGLLMYHYIEIAPASFPRFGISAQDDSKLLQTADVDVNVNVDDDIDDNEAEEDEDTSSSSGLLIHNDKDDNNNTKQ